MSGRSSSVFQLGGDNGEEDYLSFGWEAGGDDAAGDYAPAASSTKGGKKGKKGKKPAAAREEYVPDYDFMDGGEASDQLVTTTSKGKKIPKGKVSHHQTLCLQIQTYASHTRFEEAIKKSGLKVDRLETLNVSELEELLQRVRVVALNSTGNGSNPAHMVTIGAAGFIEKVVPPHMANLQGYQAACAEDPQLETLCAMISIDHGFANAMPLPLQIVMCLGGIAKSVTVQNKVLEAKENMIASLQAQVNSQQPSYSPPSVPVPAAAESSSNPSGRRIRESIAVYE